MSLPRNRRAERAVIRMLDRGVEPAKLQQFLDEYKAARGDMEKMRPAVVAELMGEIRRAYGAKEVRS